MKHLVWLLMLVGSSLLHGAELRRTHCFGTAKADRDAAWDGHVDYVSWVDEDTVVSWANTGDLVGRDIKTGKELWSQKGLLRVEDWSVSRKHRRLAILFDTRSSGFNSKLLRVFNCSSGEVIAAVDTERFTKLAKGTYEIPSRIAFAPDDSRLVVCAYSTYFGRNAYVLDPALTKVEATFDIDASPREITISPDGARATVIADKKVLCIRDMKANGDIYLSGNRVLKKPEFLTAEIDAPFTSHARHDGDRTLVYTVDNSWATGTVRVLDLKTKETKSFDARNGHIEMDVDFGRKRIALTGTSTNLTMMGFDGEVIAHLPKATLQRNVWVEFSPSGKQLAVGSWDNTVTIFAIVE